MTPEMVYTFRYVWHELKKVVRTPGPQGADLSSTCTTRARYTALALKTLHLYGPFLVFYYTMPPKVDVWLCYCTLIEMCTGTGYTVIHFYFIRVDAYGTCIYIHVTAKWCISFCILSI